MDVKTIEASVLRIQYREYGPADGWPCIMMHGFPYDVHAYGDAAPILAESRARASSYPICGGTAERRFYRTKHRARASKPRSGPTYWR